jgi:hypothetical protein
MIGYGSLLTKLEPRWPERSMMNLRGRLERAHGNTRGENRFHHSKPSGKRNGIREHWAQRGFHLSSCSISGNRPEQTLSSALSAAVQSKSATVIVVRIDASGYVAQFNALRNL